MSEYKVIEVETFIPAGEQSSAKLRVRPVKGQRYPQNTRVQCSREMRQKYPVGTRFRLKVMEKHREGGKLFLFSPNDWGYEVIRKVKGGLR